MIESVRFQQARNWLRIVRPFVGVFVLAAALAGQAWAQSEGEASTRAQLPFAEKKPAEASADPAAVPTPTDPAPGAVPGPQRIRTKPAGTPPSAFDLNPDAKWVCEKPVAEAEPVWRGDKRLTFSFDIRNAGTADLRINAKGG